MHGLRLPALARARHCLLTRCPPDLISEEAALMRTLQNGRTCNGLHGRDRILLFHHGFYQSSLFPERDAGRGRGTSDSQAECVAGSGLTLRNLHAQTFAMGQKQTICRHVPWRPTLLCG